MDLTTFALSNPPKDVETPLLFDANAQQRNLSWNGYASATKRIAVALRQMGVVNQDCVGLFSSNDLYYYVVAHGVIAAGAVFTGIPTYAKQSELATAINVADIRVLFVSAEFLDIALSTVHTLTTTPPRIIIFDPPGIEEVPYSKSHNNLSSLSTMINSADECLFANANEGTDPAMQTAYRVFTSGTTGSVKAVEVSHTTHLKRIMSTMLQASPVSDNDQRASLQLIGMYHVSAIVASERAFLGQWVLYVSNQDDGQRIVVLVRSLRLTDLRLSSGMVNDILDAVEDGKYSYDALTSVRRVVLGGSLCRWESIDAFTKVLPTAASILIAYGSTECWGISYASVDKNWVTGCCGRVARNIDVRIFDPETGEAVPQGTSGEVCVRSDMVISKYFNNPVATKSAFVHPPAEEGWFRTGDKGYFCPSSQQLFLVGRFKEIFKVQYEEVSPAEVESQICRHPSVVECYVTSQPARWDETDNECVAFVVKKQGVELSAQEVADYVASALSAHKAPTGAVIFCREIPRIHMDKVVKSKVEAVEWLRGSVKLLPLPYKISR